MSQQAKDKLYEAVITSLRKVIDPETRVDVVKMRLVDKLTVDQKGNVSYIFRPSSVLCPIAVHLALQIKQAIAAVPGITKQKIRIEGYIGAQELTKLINQED